MVPILILFKGAVLVSPPELCSEEKNPKFPSSRKAENMKNDEKIQFLDLSF